MIGTAKITSNEGAGKYKITQMFWDGTSSYVTGNVGLVEADASDVSLNASRSVDDPVAFQMQETYTGNRQAVIIGPSNSDTSFAGAFVLNKQYFIEGDVGWTTIDTRDWRGRWCWVSAIHDPGELNEFDDQYVEHWDSIAGAYAFQTTQPHAWFQVLLNSTDAVQGITRILHDPGGVHEGDFYLRMKTDGNLEYMVENWAQIFSVRFSLSTSSPPPTEEEVG